MTEIGGIATVQTKQCKMSDSVGFVIPNIQLKVIDPATSEIFGPNKPGEICLKSPTAMLGYYKNPAATKATIDEQGTSHQPELYPICLLNLIVLIVELASTDFRLVAFGR